jgi:aminomethyltransferase
MLVCNAGCADKDLAHIEEHAAGRDVRVTVRDRAFIAVQGPQAENVLRAAGMDELPSMFLDAHELSGGRFISRSGYTGEDGFEIALAPHEAEAFARRLLSDDRAMMIGLGARDSLRLEAGLPLYGQDLSEDITPLEAGLSWAVPASHRNGGGFIGALALAAHFANGRKRKRIAFVPEGNAPVRSHAPVLDAQGKQVGEVTSGGFGPTVNHPVGMALVAADAGETLFADLRGRQIPIRQAKLPFVPHQYKN